jgi:hypothetical protein
MVSTMIRDLYALSTLRDINYSRDILNIDLTLVNMFWLSGDVELTNAALT